MNFECVFKMHSMWGLFIYLFVISAYFGYISKAPFFSPSNFMKCLIAFKFFFWSEKSLKNKKT